MNYKNAYERLQYYFSQMVMPATEDDETDYEEGITISSLHEHSGIPLSVIRADIICLFQYSHNILLKGLSESSGKNMFLFFDSDDVETTDLIDELTDNLIDINCLSRLISMIQEGTLDETPVYLSSMTNMDDYLLSLTPDEAVALNTHLSDDNKVGTELKLLNKSFHPCFRIKDSFRYFSNYNDLNSLLNVINNAIELKQAIKIRYKPNHGSSAFFEFIPLKISYDTDDNSYAVITVIDKKISIFPLENIHSCQKSKNKLPVPDASFLSIAANVWGNSFSDKPVKVKIKFYSEANVYEKAKRYLSIRTNGKLYEKGENMYYEDTVYGIDKFTNWIYGFGSSAIVLKPKSLQKRIIESYKKRSE